MHEIFFQVYRIGVDIKKLDTHLLEIGWGEKMKRKNEPTCSSGQDNSLILPMSSTESIIKKTNILLLIFGILGITDMLFHYLILAYYYMSNYGSLSSILAVPSLLSSYALMFLFIPGSIVCSILLILELFFFKQKIINFNIYKYAFTANAFVLVINFLTPVICIFFTRK